MPVLILYLPFYEMFDLKKKKKKSTDGFTHDCDYSLQFQVICKPERYTIECGLEVAENMSAKYFSAWIKVVLSPFLPQHVLFRILATRWQQRRHDAYDVTARLGWWKKMGQVLVFFSYQHFLNVTAQKLLA